MNQSLPQTNNARHDEPLLADTLRLLMPCPSTTLLLQAALRRGDAVKEAWTSWRRLTPQPKAFLASDRVGIKRHLPLLYRNLTLHDVEPGRDLEPYFRAARAREELRSVRYRQFLSEAIDALQATGVAFIAGKGVTIGETVHTDPVLRHSHDIDLLVQSADLPAATAALARAGFTAALSSAHRAEARFDHESGLPVELHTRLYYSPLYDGDLDALWRRAREGKILDRKVLLIGDADLMVHAPVHASLVPQRKGLGWIVDLATLLSRRANESAAVDWNRVFQIAHATRAELPLYVMYRYLSQTFGAMIPQQVIDELRSAACRGDTLRRLAAIDGIRAEPKTRRIQTLLDASDGRSRMAIVSAMLFPPPAYFRLLHPQRSAIMRSCMYGTRPARFIGRQFRRGYLRIYWKIQKLFPQARSNSPALQADTAGRQQA